jgi:hypothetical protein
MTTAFVRPTSNGMQHAQQMQQRTAERFAVKVPGILKIPSARSGTYLITVLDASRTGLRVSCSLAIPSGTPVEIKVLGATIKGTARYARDFDREYHVGIEAESLEPQPQGAESGELDLIPLFAAHATTAPLRRR